MKKSFHVFFLFVLFAFFAVNAAWAADVTLQTDAQTGEKYVNMPKGKGYITIPEGVTSFKIYDDGGKDGNYSGDYGQLILEAPVDHKLVLTGSVNSYYDDHGTRFIVYDGTPEHAIFLLFKDGDVSQINQRSSDNIMSIYFSGDCDNTDTGLDLLVTVVPSYSVTVNEVDGGTVETDKTKATQDETVTLTITPDESNDYLFKGIKVVKKGTTEEVTVNVTYVWETFGGPATFTMPASDVTVTPAWKKKHSVTVTEVTGGSVTTDKTKATQGELVTLTITPASDYLFDKLEVTYDANNSAVEVSVSDNKTSATFTMPDGDVTVTPAWKKQHSVTVTEVTGGSVTANKTKATQGELVTLTITPASDYLFDKLEVTYGENNSTVDVSVSDNKTSATFTMPDGDVTVTPAWKKQHSVTVTEVTGGTVTTDKAEATQGETVTLTITPDDGYLFKSFEVKDAANNLVSVMLSSDKSSATFEMPASDVIVISRWEKQFGVSVANVTGGVVETDKVKATQGETVTLTATLEDGYLLKGVEVKDKDNQIIDVNVDIDWFSSSTTNTATFVMLDADITVTPVFSTNFTAEAGFYVKLPKTGTKNVTIPANVASFKVYDDGGRDRNFSENANGSLVLTAPADVKFIITGSKNVNGHTSDVSVLVINDGNADANKLVSSNYGDLFDISTRTSGNVMTIKFYAHRLLPPAPGLDFTVTLVKSSYGAVAFEPDINLGFGVTINGDYEENEALSIPSAIEVSSVKYNREIEAGVPVTAMLPVTLPAGTTVNAKFYTLKEVVQDGNKWHATMKYIGDEILPQPNTPYAVILNEGESSLRFDLHGKKATVQTGDIQKTCGFEKACNLDENDQITDDWYFTGTYASKVWNAGDEELGLAYAFAATNNLGGAAKGKFGKIVAGASGSPMRCYLRKRDANVKLKQQNQTQLVAAAPYVARYSVNNLPETIDVEFVKDDEKGGRTVLHGRMNTVTGEFKMLRDYDLKGRKVNSTNRARGAYYGKKVLKK